MPLRSDAWFNGFDLFVNSLKADSDLQLALKTIEQIAVSAKSARASFLEAAQRAAVEVYREPLTQAAVWPVCAGEWGQGPGFRHRVANHLENWFGGQSKLKETLEDVLENLWEQSVIRSLRKVSQENGNDESGADECQSPSQSGSPPDPTARTGVFLRDLRRRPRRHGARFR